MHFTALLTSITALIPVFIPAVAPSTQSAELNVHLKFNPKDAAGPFIQRKAKTDPKNAEVPPGSSLPNPFYLKGYLEQGLVVIDSPSPLYYQFSKAYLGEHGTLANQATAFRLQAGKLVLGDYAVGLNDPFEEEPLSAILVHPQQGLNFTVDSQIENKLLVLRIVDLKPLIFQGPSFISGIDDSVNIGLTPSEFFCTLFVLGCFL